MILFQEPSITIFAACNCEIPRNCPVSFYKEFKIVCIVGLTSDSVLWQPCPLQCWGTHSFQGSAELSSTEDSLKISEMKATPPHYSIRNKRQALQSHPLVPWSPLYSSWRLMLATQFFPCLSLLVCSRQCLYPVPIKTCHFFLSTFTLFYIHHDCISVILQNNLPQGSLPENTDTKMSVSGLAL